VFDCFPSTTTANNGRSHCHKFHKSRSHAIRNWLCNFFGDRCSAGFKMVQPPFCVCLFLPQHDIAHVHTLSLASNNSQERQHGLTMIHSHERRLLSSPPSIKSSHYCFCKFVLHNSFCKCHSIENLQSVPPNSSSRSSACLALF
jgi:hypothetical protein